MSPTLFARARHVISSTFQTQQLFDLTNEENVREETNEGGERRGRRERKEEGRTQHLLALPSVSRVTSIVPLAFSGNFSL